ncbi:restriction endonuclease subunit S [Cellulomonas sp. SLBN-39]|uniref:restriction endonuclease subunit S n=1 Tax=Cellulomonas sp. SLBN-39 TaxID=2768446 RepID=UPI00114E2043|nr:restriction endonuclease subunit S [Cellulomonas sp. SLBN-39]TQL01355.1 restriction endonuclease S subunit [Cellulomonas sp. SLBN-39]
MPEWPTARIGEHVKRVVEPVRLEPDREYSSLGIRYGSGIYVRSVKFGRQLRTRMYRAGAGQFIYCILDSQRGPFDVVPEELDGAIITNKFPTYEVGPDLLPEFLKLTFQRRATLESIGAARQGAEGRSEWKPDQFEAHVIPFPPRRVQGRIIEIMASFDAMREALEAEVAAVQAARPAILAEMLQRRDDSWTEAPVGEIGTLTRGKRFIKSDYVDSGIGCIHYSQIHTDFGALTDDVHSWLPEAMRPKLRYAEPGDLVIAGTSENVDGVLKAVAWLGSEPVAVHDDAYIWKHSLEPRFASYLFASPAFRAQIQRVFSDTKVVRVSKDNLERLTLPIPPRDVQETIADAMAALDRRIAATAEESVRAQAARAALLDALLTRKVAVSVPPDDDVGDPGFAGNVAVLDGIAGWNRGSGATLDDVLTARDEERAGSAG